MQKVASTDWTGGFVPPSPPIFAPCSDFKNYLFIVVFIEKRVFGIFIEKIYQNPIRPSNFVKSRNCMRNICAFA